MRRILSLLGLVAMIALAVVLPVSARTSTHKCKYAQNGLFNLRVHNVSCKAAKSNIKHAYKGYNCKQVGHPTRPPFTQKCTRKRHRNQYYTFQFRGG